MVQFNFVSYVYNDKAILSHINIRFESGELVHLYGPSGSGKTTFLKLIYGILPPTSGNLIVMGKNMRNISGFSLSKIRKNIGLIMDEFGLINGSVLKNLNLVLNGFPKEERRIRIDYYLNLVELTWKRKEDISFLSSSEKRQIFLVRAIITEPSILLADEPTSCCDRKKEELILDILKRMQENGTLVIIASCRDIPILGKRLIHLENGRIKEYGKRG